MPTAILEGRVMSPFKPIGERARWRIVYDLLCKTPTGDVLTYEAIGEALGLDSESERHVIQMAVRRAAKEHEEADKRAIEVVPNKGYRVVEAPEHLRLARGHHKRASKSLVRGQSKVVHVDLGALEPDTRRAFEVVAAAFAAQIEFNKRFDLRQKRLEKAFEDIAARTDKTEQRTEQEIAELKARLARLEGEQT
jgi:alkylated DNA nucleotide flippase Atl1